MKSRSEWLRKTRDYTKQFKFGRKYFKVHKNQQSPEELARIRDSSTPLNASLHASRPLETYSFTPKPGMKPHVSFRENQAGNISPKSPREREMSPFFNKMEAKSSPKLFVDFEKPRTEIKPINTELLGKPRSIIKLRPLVERNEEKTMREPPPVRNLSTPNYRPFSILELSSHPAFKQPRYPKNKPKIYMSNPITGVPTFNTPYS